MGGGGGVFFFFFFFFFGACVYLTAWGRGLEGTLSDRLVKVAFRVWESVRLSPFSVLFWLLSWRRLCFVSLECE